MAVLRYGIGLCCCDMVLAYGSVAIWYWPMLLLLRLWRWPCCCVRALVSLPLCLVIDMRFIDMSFRFILEEVSVCGLKKVCGLNKRLRYVGCVY